MRQSTKLSLRSSGPTWPEPSARTLCSGDFFRCDRLRSPKLLRPRKKGIDRAKELHCAGGGTRTHTRLPSPDFESGASTDSATPAGESSRIVPAKPDANSAGVHGIVLLSMLERSRFSECLFAGLWTIGSTPTSLSEVVEPTRSLLLPRPSNGWRAAGTASATPTTGSRGTPGAPPSGRRAGSGARRERGGVV